MRHNPLFGLLKFVVPLNEPGLVWETFVAPVSNNLQWLMLMTLESRRKQTGAFFDYKKFSL